MKSLTDGLEHHLVMPYLTGIYLAVNALRDAYLVVDGPNCVFFRTAQIQGNHDWHSTLASCTGLHRVADTDCTTERAAVGDQRLLMSRLLEVDAIADCRLILLTAMSPIALTGRQYENVLGELKGRITKPVVQIRSGSLTGDWLHGYLFSLQALAGQLDLSENPDLRDDEVAVVGYLMDRNEDDHLANLRELARLLEGMSLKLVSCWLSGGKVEDLRQATRAGTILSFPHGRQAARTLSQRTGARLLECDLPLGLEGTCRWLRDVGQATGRSKEAEQIIDRELGQTLPKLKWILQHSLLNKSVVLMGSDPNLLKALATAVEELGCRVTLVASFAHRAHGAGSEGEQKKTEWLVNPDGDEFHSTLRRMQGEGCFDMAIVNSQSATFFLERMPRMVPFIELGFPSYYTHALTDSPFLGFEGILKLTERMTNAITQASVSTGGITS